MKTERVEMSRTQALLSRVFFGLITLAIVLGPPAILLSLGLKKVIPDIDWNALPNRLRAGDVPVELLTAAFMAVAWLVWFCIVLSIAVELVAAMRSVEAPSLPTLPGTQFLARRLVAGVLLTINGLAVTATPALAQVAPAVISIDETVASETAAAPVASVAPVESFESPVLTYRVERGDTFMSIAEETLGTPERWKEIRSQNIGVSIPGGATVQPGDIAVVPGTVLILPDDATPAVSAPVAATGLSDVTGLSSVTAPGSVASDDVVTGPERSPGEQVQAEIDAALAKRAVPENHPAGANGAVLSAAKVEVEDGDHFWSIASDTLATAWGRTPTNDEITPYWTDLVEMNRGDLAPPGDPDLIFEGQSFHIPSVPADPAAPVATSVEDRAGEEVLTELEAPAKEEISTEPEAVVEAPVDQFSELPALGVNEPQVTEGDAVTMSAAPVTPPPVAEVDIAEGDTAEAPVAAGAAAAVEHTSGSPVTPSAEALKEADAALEGSTGWGSRLIASSVVGSVAAAGAMKVINRRRKQGLASRNVGERSVPFNEAGQELEKELRLTAAPQQRQRLFEAMASLQRELKGAATPLLVQVDDDGVIEVAFGETVTLQPSAVSGWEATAVQGANRTFWRLGEDRATRSPGEIDPWDVPLLAGVGDGTYLNIEAMGWLGVDGPADLVTDHVRFMIHDIVNNVADAGLILRMGAVGVINHQVADMGEVSHEVRALFAEIDREHDRAGTTNYASLVHRVADTPHPSMVVCCTAEELELIRWVADKLAEHPGRYPIGLIVAGDGAGAPWVSRLDDEGLALRSDFFERALRLQPETMTSERGELMEHMFTTAVRTAPRRLYDDAGAGGDIHLDGDVEMVDISDTETQIIKLGMLPAPGSEIGTELPEGAPDADVESLANVVMPRVVRINVLGPVEVHGTDLSGYPLSALTLLAMRAEQMTVDQMRDVMWPNGIGKRRCRDVLSQLRQGAGASVTHDSTLGYTASVDTDAAEFERLCRVAGDQDPVDAVVTLREAAGLVRGMPFDASVGGAWEWVDGVGRCREMLQNRIEDTMQRLAELAVDLGDWNLAIDAAAQGRRMNPLSEVLTKTHVRALVHLGRSDQARRIVDRWEQDFQDAFDDEPGTSPRDAYRSALGELSNS